ncbi:MAG TPA: PLP-dependent aminotransferase family protein [Candidatus Polarisedimenticolia bacterium]|nr:PLP-dependent aminotransferase family protein [Candidatus Polarisedimenticolia bacterium]
MSRPMRKGPTQPHPLGFAPIRDGGVALYRQLVDRVREAIAAGALATGERLPTTRSLALSLDLNRLTVARAYEELARLGLVEAHVGRGTFVADAIQRSPRVDSQSRPAGEPAVESLRWSGLIARSADRAIEEGLPPAMMGATRAGTISFASLFPDPALFPVERFRRALDDVLRKDGHKVLGYGPPAGHPPLRTMIAEGLRSRGMQVENDEIVVTSGSQQGIDLVARALLDPGDTVVVENPTYAGAVQVFHSYGAQLIGIPVDAQGAVVARLEEAVERRRPKLIYLMPNFQNPTSETMSLKRRLAVLDLARSRRLAVLEDDFGGDLRFEGPDLPALKALGGGANVVYLSTFAKKLLPGLRIGWIAAPRELVERLVGLKKITDYSTSLLLQAALHEFCRRGDLDRHLSHVIGRYRERRDAMVASMKRCFPAQAVWSRPAGGLVVWVTLPDGVDSGEVAMEADSRGVYVGRGDLFYVDGGTRQNLRLTYAQAGPREIQRGIRILGDIIKQKLRTRRTAPRSGATGTLPLI